MGQEQRVDDDGDDDVVTLTEGSVIYPEYASNTFKYTGLHESMTGWFGGSGPA
jgi:hypothetical protein